MATLTINTTAPQDARIVAAFGSFLGLGRDATAAEVKADLIAYLVRIVRREEENAAHNAAIAAITPITPT